VKITFGFCLPGDSSRIADNARELEDLGYDFIGQPEHLMMGNPPSATSLSLPSLAVAAGATRRIRLLNTVVILPLYHPVMLAKEVIGVDNASNGRLDFGIGVGGESVHEYRAANIPLNERGRRANELLGLLKRLWTEKNVSHQGRYYQVDDVTLNPPSTQKPHPPIWVAGRSEAAQKRAGKYGDGWLPYMYNADRYRKSVAVISGAAKEAGRSLDGFVWGFHQNTVLAETREEAFEEAVKGFGYQSGRDPSTIVEDYFVYGTPDDLIKGYERIIDAGVRAISVLSGGGANQSMERARIIAERVIPYFRTL
jgi:probable F420-dependent oxidoreductase